MKNYIHGTTISSRDQHHTSKELYLEKSLSLHRTGLVQVASLPKKSLILYVSCMLYATNPWQSPPHQISFDL